MDQFQLFNTPHLIVIFATVVLSVLFPFLGKYGGKYSRGIITFILLGSLAFSLVTAAVVNYSNGYLSISRVLPMHLSDWIITFVFVAFITRNIYSFEVLYFWGMGGTLQAIVTPELTVNFPGLAFILFFINHSVIIICIIYLMVVYRLRPFPVSIKRVFIWSQVYFLTAFLTNLMLDTNYGFLMEKPGQGTLIDFLGPWPLYLISLEVIALLSFFIYYLPFFIYDRFKKRSLNHS
jgi:hypothetical integral membrane protein (TIGR02206 family)